MLPAHHTPLQIAGQVLIGSLFIAQGLGALPHARFKFHSGRLGERRIPAPDFVLVCGLAMMLLAGGVMMIADIYSEVGAALLLVFSIVATLLFQKFWTVQAPTARHGKRGTFFNNLAVIGGLLLVLAFG